MFTAAVTVIAAIAAAIGAGLLASALLGRSLSSYELVELAVSFALVGWGLTASHRRRERKRMLEMRDSALW